MVQRLPIIGQRIEPEAKLPGSICNVREAAEPATTGQRQLGERSSQSLTIIFKATECCNASCVYCSVGDKSSKPERMSLELARVFWRRVAEYLRADTKRVVNVTWHGGEPTLMGADFFNATRHIIKEELGSDVSRLSHGMQSNLTLLDDELIEELRLLGLQSVGTSYEYAEGLRGLGPRTDWKEYNRRFFEGLARLRRHGMGVGAIYVVTARTVDRPEQTMIFLQNLLGKAGFGQFRINALYHEGEATLSANAELAVTPEQFGNFLGRAFVHWYPRRQLLSGVAPFQGIYLALTGNSRWLSCEEAGQCGTTHVAVSPTGEIYQCGRSVDNGSFRYATLAECSFDEVFELSAKRELIERSKRLQESQCKECTIWAYCHGGCPIDSRIYHGDPYHKTFFCESRRIFIEQYVQPLLRKEGLLADHPDHPQ